MKSDRGVDAAARLIALRSTNEEKMHDEESDPRVDLSSHVPTPGSTAHPANGRVRASFENDETYQNVELWVRELRAAGWTAVIARHRPARFEATEQTTTTWRAPSGTLYRGPYKAWCIMKDSQWEMANGEG